MGKPLMQAQDKGAVKPQGENALPRRQKYQQLIHRKTPIGFILLLESY
jgi:hypothetical protein